MQKVRALIGATVVGLPLWCLLFFSLHATREIATVGAAVSVWLFSQLWPPGPMPVMPRPTRHGGTRHRICRPPRTASPWTAVKLRCPDPIGGDEPASGTEMNVRGSTPPTLPTPGAKPT